MSVAQFGRVSSARLYATTALAAVVLVIAGLFGSCSLLTAVGAAIAVPTLLPATALLRQERTLSGEPVDASATLAGVAVVGAAVTAGLLPLTSESLRAAVAAAGLTSSGFLLILMLLRTIRPATRLSRLRYGWEGVTSGVAVAVAVAGWPLASGTTVGSWFGYLAVTVAVGVTTVSGMVLVHTRQARRRAALCRLVGAVAMATGQALLVAGVSASTQPHPMFLATAAGCMLVGPPLLWAGLSEVSARSAPLTVAIPAWGAASLLLIPVAAAVLVSAHHLMTAGRIPADLVPLITVFGVSLAVREILVEIERCRGARLLARARTRLRALDREVLSQELGTDRVTGLANRRELFRAISARRRANRNSGALVVVGLTGPRSEPGAGPDPALLRTVGDRLRRRVGPAGLVARSDEDEFAVVTADGPVEAYALGLGLQQELSEAHPNGDTHMSPSIGVTDLGGEGPEEVLRRGQLARQRAAGLPPPRIDWYDEAVEQQQIRRLDLERHLPGAAGRRELDLVYQPVLDLTTGRPVGVEALLRWRHPVLGTVLPSEFLPVAEKLRAGPELGEWALHMASRQVAGWRRAGYDLWLAVNVSASQLEAGFVSEVAAALSVHQCPPERLVVEISEAEVGEQVAVVAEQLSKLRALGVRVCLDDFGSASTDLGRLRRLPLDLVKLGAPRGAEPASDMVRAMVDLAHRLGLAVVVEGLESNAQLTTVTRAGCRHGQGFLLAAPAPAEYVTTYLAREMGSVSPLS